MKRQGQEHWAVSKDENSDCSVLSTTGTSPAGDGQGGSAREQVGPGS